ncbi:DUF1345 domain-containing protein [Manganibacter manganicus]|uniref:DUF1345 domain-containing protein n=1 Tax=Manganibacter manganicus TaxID=1873176 RepID=A0A1V8RRL3_9HYPH|nr:DUF1345 domain-containing protein [Pseudaminobacter manganicus]OQM75817.1 hypothetical protein BFN67_02605 [Pseudaminobacter manganicus]
MSAKKPLHRHVQFSVSACIGVIALFAALLVHAPLAYSIGANVFFAGYIGLVLIQMPRLTSGYLSENARAADQPVTVIFIVTFLVVCVAIASLFQLINAKGDPHPVELIFAMASVPLGWFTIHAMFALHYAHVFWMNDDETDSQSKRSVPIGGLQFPGKKKPDGLDFLYFSTVIGMTSQTSDTGVTTTQMRRIVLIHSVASFFFNTVIVAAAVNLAVSLGG